MYKLIAAISLLIRNFYLPNPFEHLKMGVLINWGIGLILFPITFLVVGLFYERRSAPILGSVLYLFFYALHTGLIILCGVFNFVTIAIIAILFLYVMILIGLVLLKNKLSWGWN